MAWLLPSHGRTLEYTASASPSMAKCFWVARLPADADRGRPTCLGGALAQPAEDLVRRLLDRAQAVHGHLLLEVPHAGHRCDGGRGATVDTMDRMSRPRWHITAGISCGTVPGSVAASPDKAIVAHIPILRLAPVVGPRIARAPSIIQAPPDFARNSPWTPGRVAVGPSAFRAL